MIFIIIILLGIIVFLGLKLKTKVIIDKSAIDEYNSTIQELKIYQNNLHNEIDKSEQKANQLNVQIKSLQQEYQSRYTNLDEHFEQLTISREKLLETAWGYDYYGDTRTVDMHIQRLRKKLNWENVIVTVFKYGYRLEIE